MLLLVNMQSNLHCKQGKSLVNMQGDTGYIILQLPVVYIGTTETTTSFQKNNSHLLP